MYIRTYVHTYIHIYVHTHTYIITELICYNMHEKKQKYSHACYNK